MFGVPLIRHTERRLMYYSGSGSDDCVLQGTRCGGLYGVGSDGGYELIYIHMGVVMRIQ